MDKEKATRTLAKELGDKLGRAEVIEGSYKDSLIKNSSAAYQVGNLFFFEFCSNKFSIPEYNASGETTLTELVFKHNPSFADANYFFLESIHAQGQKYGADKSRFVATSYALIGEKEKTSLRKLFYKNVQPEIACAMKALGIRNFIDFYATYYDRSHDKSLIQILKEEDSIMKEDLEVAKKFIDTALKLKCDDDAEVSKDLFRKNLEDFKSLNVRFERIGIKTRIESYDATARGYVTRATLLKLVGELSSAINGIKSEYKDTLWNEFVDFVFFYLPVEEQSIESNKYILKSSQNLDFVTAVLSKEYSEGKHFQEYFDVLDKEAQDKVVKSLKVFSGRKPVYDSFLWSKGFKDINLDYVNMYKKDANIFIDYFSKRDPEEKKVIIKDVMNCDFVNEKVADWLNQNEPDLLREVGLNG